LKSNKNRDRIEYNEKMVPAWCNNNSLRSLLAHHAPSIPRALFLSYPSAEASRGWLLLLSIDFPSHDPLLRRAASSQLSLRKAYPFRNNEELKSSRCFRAISAIVCGVAAGAVPPLLTPPLLCLCTVGLATLPPPPPAVLLELLFVGSLVLLCQVVVSACRRLLCCRCGYTCVLSVAAPLPPPTVLLATSIHERSDGNIGIAGVRKHHVFTALVLLLLHPAVLLIYCVAPPQQPVVLLLCRRRLCAAAALGRWLRLLLLLVHCCLGRFLLRLLFRSLCACFLGDKDASEFTSELRVSYE
jgi:hypothetical protein